MKKILAAVVFTTFIFSGPSHAYSNTPILHCVDQGWLDAQNGKSFEQIKPLVAVELVVTQRSDTKQLKALISRAETTLNDMKNMQKAMADHKAGRPPRISASTGWRIARLDIERTGSNEIYRITDAEDPSRLDSSIRVKDLNPPRPIVIKNYKDSREKFSVAATASATLSENGSVEQINEVFLCNVLNPVAP